MGQQPQPQQTFRQPAPQETFRRPQPQPQTRPQEPQTIALSGDGFEAPVVPSSKFNCPITTPDHQYNGRGYAVTFFDKSDGCNKFQAEEAVEFCKSIGGQVVSLDSNEKALAMMDLLRQRAHICVPEAGLITMQELLHGHLEPERVMLGDKGSGLLLEVRSLLLNPNLTTVTAMKSALESSTTSTPMVSNGMTFLTTTKNQLFVNFKSMDSNWSQVELTNIMKHSISSTLLPKLRKKEFCTLLLKLYLNKILKMLFY